jgi:hypothetical protein
MWGVGLETRQFLRLFALCIWNLEITYVVKIRLLLLVYTGGQFLLASFPCYPTLKTANYLHTVQYLKLVNSCIAW